MNVTIREKFERVYSRTNGEKEWYLFVRKNGSSIVFDKVKRPMTFEQCHFYQDYIGKGMPLVEVFSYDSETELEQKFKEERSKYKEIGINTFKL